MHFARFVVVVVEHRISRFTPCAGRSALAALAAACLGACAGSPASGATLADREPAAATAAAAPLAFPSDKMVAHFIDVDQGNAALLEFSCGAVLVDVGGQSNASTARLVDYLDEFFDRRTDLEETLDVVFITHPHLDHNRALKAVMKQFKVRNYVDNGFTSGSGRFAALWVRDDSPEAQAQRRNEPVVTPIHDEFVTADATRSGFTSVEVDPLDCTGSEPAIRILSGGLEDNPGWSDSAYANLNNHSLVIRVDFGETSLLFTGDLQEHGIDTLVDWYDGTSTLDVDLYHVGHHGSHNATTDGLLAALTPDYAIISMGRWDDRSSKFCANAFGHPRKNVVDLLSAQVAQPRTPPVTRRAATTIRRFQDVAIAKAIYATGWDGTVRMEIELDGTVEFTTDR